MVLIHALALVFLAVLLGTFWDLYGRGLLCQVDSSSQTKVTGNINAPAQAPTGNDAAPVNAAADAKIAPPPGGGEPPPPPAGGTNAPKPPGGGQAAPSSVDPAVYAKCLKNTSGEGPCKDCCDCLEGDASVYKACRDTCPGTDFSQNTEIIKLDAPSKLGPNGDYSACTSSGTAQACKKCCDDSTRFSCGDFKYCRKACDGLGQ